MGLFAAEVEVAAFHQRFHLAVGDGALVHPEPAVGVDPLDAALAEDLGGVVDAGGDLVGGFDGIGLDVDDAQADGQVGAKGFEVVELGIASEGEFEDDVVGVEGVEEVGELGPGAVLDGLAAVVAEAEMNGTFRAPSSRFRVGLC